MELNEVQRKLCATSEWDFSGLKALFMNCTLKRSPELSHTEGLMRMCMTIMDQLGVSNELLRPVDYAIAPGCTLICGSTAGKVTTGPGCSTRSRPRTYW